MIVSSNLTINAPSKALHWAYISVFLLLVAYLGWSYFFAVKDFPNYHGDESGFLNIPYRWCEYHDTRYPAAWSHAHGSDQVRRYPPPATFVLRSQFHSLVGFSPMKSRVFSGLLILLTVVTAGVFVNRWSSLARWQQLLVVAQVGLAPVMIYTARSTRIEQEVLFFGWIGAVVLPSWIPMISSRLVKAGLWVLSGIFVSWAGNSHPFGLVFCLVGVWLLLTATKWAELDGLRLWQRLGLIGSGVLLVCIPTLLWIAQSWDHFRGYADMQRDLYAVREGELIDYYAAQNPFARFDGTLAKPLIARLNVLYAASYEDYFNYPVPTYRYRWLLETWFITLFALIVAYFLFLLWRRFQTNDPWLLLLVLLSLGFVGFQLWYPPATTYKAYVTFFVYLTGSVVMWKLIAKVYATRRIWLASMALAAIYMAATGLVLHYSAKHLQYVMQSSANGNYPNVSLDQEFDALKDMSHRLALDGNNQVVYTSVESWIASGKDTHSLWESVMLGLIKLRSDADGVVFKNSHMNFIIITSGGDKVSKFPTREQRMQSLDQLLSPMRLTGLIVSDFTPEGAYCFYSKDPDNQSIRIARLTRSQETVIYRTEAAPTPVSADAIRLEPGQYVVCTWADVDPGMARLELSLADAKSGDALQRVTFGPLSTRVPSPFFLEVKDGPGQYRIDVVGARPESRLGKCLVYKLVPQ